MDIFDSPWADCTLEHPIENPCGCCTKSVVFIAINEPNCVGIVLQCILCVWNSGKILVTRKAKAGIVYSVTEDCR